MGKIYLIKCYNDYEVLYKIGFTRGKPENRLKQLETGNPKDLELVYEFNTKFNSKLESTLHRHYNTKRIKNEWFKLDDDDVKNFKTVCEKIEEKFEFLLKENHFFKKLL